MQRREGLPYQKAIEALETFSRQRLAYIIVGGAALALHGIPRATIDVDIVVPARPESIIKLYKAAKSIGLKWAQKDILLLVNDPRLIIGQWITLEDRNKVQLIDVYLEEEAKFRKLYQKSIKRRGRKATFHIASLDGLEKMKKLSARPIDLADLALIQECRERESAGFKKQSR